MPDFLPLTKTRPAMGASRARHGALLPSVAQKYDGLVAAGEIEPDPAQIAAVGALDALNGALAEFPGAAHSSGIGWLFRRRSSPPTGLYLWGDVGRGKTLLMDLFFSICVSSCKQRCHFHEFMASMHRQIKEIRATGTEGDPVAPLAAKIATTTRLLCLDEFTVTDIADAMLLGRLFDALFARHIVVVATSNVAPRDLFADGLNRSHFLKFAARLEQNVNIIHLEAAQDYRALKMRDSQLYLSALTDDHRAQMDQIWRKLTLGRPAQSRAFVVNGRRFELTCCVAGAVRTDFATLCAMPMSAADYLEIARAFDTVMLENVPVMDFAARNEARRFINLIDTLYDHRVRLLVCAADEPESLYIARRGEEKRAFARTASRLQEMRTRDWLAQRFSEGRAAPASVSGAVAGS